MADEVRRISPLEGVVSTFQGMADKVIGNDWWRQDALNETVAGNEIDTCESFDNPGFWETGVKRDGSWVIVAQYPSREEATKGHAKWLESLTQDPQQDLKDIDLWGLGI